MVHSNRIFGVKQIYTIEELAHLLFHHTWTECTGFYLDDYLFLNDSFSPDGAQEYAVFKISNGQFIQIESVTVSWCPSEPFVEAILSQSMKSQLFMKPYQLKIEDIETHRCLYCDTNEGTEMVQDNRIVRLKEVTNFLKDSAGTDAFQECAVDHKPDSPNIKNKSITVKWLCTFRSTERALSN